MEDDVRQSVEAFSEHRLREKASSHSNPWRKIGLWFAHHTNRIIPATAGVCAVAVALIVALPALRDPAVPPAPSMEQSSTSVARQKSEPLADQHTAHSESRMGVRPSPVPRTAEPDAQPVLARYDFGDLHLGVINTEDTTAIYLIEGNIQRQLEISRKEADVAGVITDAFTYQRDTGSPQLLLIQFRLGETEGWRVFVKRGAGFAFSKELTAIAAQSDTRDAAVHSIDSAQ
ncbi:hypothetical protein AAIB41_07410 [Brucella sp. BE17]|uniref:hypothetical protein n=1 Tax=Brucella sp. BE17 TaxID=3142977 RepID=UPI0031BA8FAF